MRNSIKKLIKATYNNTSKNTLTRIRNDTLKVP